MWYNKTVNLLPISRLMANSAMKMGGSDFKYYRSIPCPYIRDNGDPCYNELRGSPYIECPICHGRGSIYASPVLMKGIYTDQSDKYLPDGSGGFMQGSKTLSIPANYDISLMKARETEAARRYLRDKFEFLGECCEPDGSRKVMFTLWLDEDPVTPVISSGPIYHIIKVVSNYGH